MCKSQGFVLTDRKPGFRAERAARIGQFDCYFRAQLVCPFVEPLQNKFCHYFESA